ncbi:hypothetical protein B0H16DRAFT_1582513 [Mycena metata]|uniref:Uncharacterized protein n=1 Tax=Mycena metata TaxID=1033252 RepID=A0AAD7I037_9AGAR|nr:hypothetical protein B0H16DRAFT_1582513 [Mycena metata]
MTGNVAEQLLGPELFCGDSYTWLKQSDYLLRLRYSSGWTPPWTNDATKNAGRAPEIINATRVADGTYAILKRSKRSDAALSQEVYMFREFSPEPLASDHPFLTIGEALGFCTAAFEGPKLTHNHNI